MNDSVLYIPVASTVLSFVFAWIVLQRYRLKRTPYLLWWSIGILTFGLGTFTEGFTAIFGWHEPVFRAWYISGALLGGAPLAQGTVYLLLSRKTANRMLVAVASVIVFAAILALLTPITHNPEDGKKLTGSVIDWTWIRAFSPFINTWAVIFLIGGAIYSAVKFARSGEQPERVKANIFIAAGAILPGIGGSFTRAGYTEVLYVTEFLGIILIYIGYRLSTSKRPAIPVAAIAVTAEAVSGGSG